MEDSDLEPRLGDGALPYRRYGYQSPRQLNVADELFAREDELAMALARRRGRWTRDVLGFDEPMARADVEELEVRRTKW